MAPSLPQFPVYDRQMADKAAVTLLSRSLTFSELEKRSAKLIQQLTMGRLNLPVGALLAFIGTVEIEIPELFLAALGAGFRILPIPDILTSEEVKGILDSYKPDVVFCSRAHWPTVVPTGSRPELKSRVFAWDTEIRPGSPDSADELKAAGLPADTLAYEALIENWRDVDVAAVQQTCIEAGHERRPPDGEDFLYFLTSGTTGKPKLVRCSRHYVQELMAVVDGQIFTGVKNGSFCGYQSFAWMGGVLTNLMFLIRGRPIVLIRGYNFEEYRNAILEHRPTHLCWLPMCFEDMGNLPPSELKRIRDAGVREVVYGGACFPLSLVRQGMEAFPSISFTQVYGSTEAGLVGMLSPEAHLAWFRYLDHNPAAPRILPTSELTMAVGGATEGLANVGIAIMAASSRESVLPVGEIGDIVIKTNNGCNGYQDAPDKEAELFLDPGARGQGGYRIGDSGKIINVQMNSASRTFLCCEGRTKDVVVTRSGYNVYSSEIAHALSTHPALGGSQVAVAGVKDSKGAFDEVCCWVSVNRVSLAKVGPGKAIDGECLKGFLRGLLAEYKVPSHIRFVEKVPLNRNGKIDARLLAGAFQRHEVQQMSVMTAPED